ncbi:MAG: Tryptophan synthase alpha chain [Owenweeksia sp. TMED14]|nr:MAG: Tryptophan synthase alpha chain [Owenweeksia sp. TMED14]
MSSEKTIMGHLVLGYPDLETSYKTAKKYVEARIKYLELQIPFSHPTADGVVITNANRQAIHTNNVTVADCLEWMKRLHLEFPKQQIVPMTYLNKVVCFGIDNFINALEALGIENLIVPDLPFDTREAQVIHTSSVKLVPVIAPNITKDRIQLALVHKPNLVYIMSDYKITGYGFGIHQNMEASIAQIRSHSDAQIGIGFGITSAADVKQIVAIADFSIVGSALIKAEEQNVLEEKLSELVSE